MGGYSEKFGNRNEARWVAKQLLLLLDEKISSVTVEPIGNDEVCADVIIENLNGEKEFHQCKANIQVDTAVMPTQTQSHIPGGSYFFNVNQT